MVAGKPKNLTKHQLLDLLREERQRSMTYRVALTEIAETERLLATQARFIAKQALDQWKDK